MVLRLAIGASVLLAGACSFDESGIGFGSDGGQPAPDSAVADAPIGNPDAPIGGPDAAPDANLPPDATASFRKSIVIGGGTVGEDLTDFPLYVALTDDDDLRDRARTDGSDLAFLAADGTTRLDAEIESWEPGTGSLTAWVRVPTIAAAADTTIYLRYGAPAIQPGDPADVWQNGFLAVFHLGDDPTGTIVDSTGTRDGNAGGGMNADDLVRAKLGDGLEFDGNNDVVDFVNPYQGGGEHTISAWVSQQPTADNDALIVLGSGGTTDRSRFLHSRFFSGGIAVGLYTDDLETDDDIQGAGFVLVHWTYDGTGQSRVYIDGALVEGPHMHNGAADTSGTEGRIGNAPGGVNGFGTNMGFNGIVDEIHLVSTARSADWITAEFANQSSPATFYEVGTEESL
jgi:hypothetical protein